MENNVIEIAKQLEDIFAKLEEMGCHGSINRDKHGRIQVLTTDVPNGEIHYRKSSGSFPFIKEVQIGNVLFFDYLTEDEAKKEFFA